MKLLITTLMVCASLAAAADNKPNADVLGRWVGGKWPLEGKMLETDFSKPLAVTGVSNCAWSPDHVFVICDQSLLEDGKPSRALSVYAFDPEKGSFHFYGLSPEGGSPHTSDLSISADGDRWVYSGKSEFKGKTVEFRTINEWHGADSVEWWSEYSSDAGQHWTKMGGGSEKRKK